MHEHDMGRKDWTDESTTVGLERELDAYTEGWRRGFAVAEALAVSSLQHGDAIGDDEAFNGDLLSHW